MSFRKLATFVAMAVAVSIILTTGVRTQALPGPPDTLSALLSEVRALRTTIEAVAAAGTNGQLTLGRLQLQEQRVNGVVGRLESTRERLADVQRQARYRKDACAELEHSVKEPAGLSAAERDEMLRMCRVDLASYAAEFEELTTEEATLASQLSAEQARWSDLNRRLEEIEMALTRRR